MVHLGRRASVFAGFLTRHVGLGWGRSVLVAAALVPLDGAFAQQEPMRPGEAFVTRFSGVTAGPGGAIVIDPRGTVGSIIDLRAPSQPPQGQHWIDEPQRLPVTAGDVGQVFGVALDDGGPPNIYLTATSAFGLHRTPDNAQWMPGMWGPGGPGAVYVLDRASGYQPRPFTKIAPNGRENTGAGLGNIAFDKWNKQFFVSDLETGMIHRIGPDGTDRGFFDHGTQGRANFLDIETKQPKSMQPIPFDPSSRALVDSCPTPFSSSPQCWNFAESGRRVWGLGVALLAGKSEVRLYYAVWSGPDFGYAPWSSTPEEEKRNSVWSVRLGPEGAFDPSDVRREFLLPDFFTKPEDMTRAGYSRPVSDISFPQCVDRPVMLVAERGGIRNLGLGADNPFATSHEARALRYELTPDGAWQPVGRYDVGFYDRKTDGQPFMRANCSGGAAFGLGYNINTWVADPGKPDQFVWMTGDSLCSPAGPCNLAGGSEAAAGAPPAPQPAAQRGRNQRAQPAPLAAPPPDQQGDDSEVHGLEGVAESAVDELAPQGAFAPYPPNGDPYPVIGPNQSYLIDTDINVDQNGAPIPEELSRNDATKIGDIAIYEMCAGRSAGFVPLLSPPMEGGHVPQLSHAMYYSHGRPLSHFRFGSHAPEFSHSRWGSHYRIWSHYRSGSHNRERSHTRAGSHDQRRSHSVRGSHNRTMSHYTAGSWNHDERRSHARSGSHSAERSHAQQRSHSRAASQRGPGGGTPTTTHRHTRAESRVTVRPIERKIHTPAVSHSTAASRVRGTRQISPQIRSGPAVRTSQRIQLQRRKPPPGGGGTFVR